jgi:SAM-dependent methyltransferase
MYTVNGKECLVVAYDGSFYAKIGNFLRESYLNYGFTRGTQQEVDFLVELFGLPAGARILDVGCGPGRHSLELARRGYRPTGVDISEGFIAVARQAAATEGLAAEFLVADARQLDLPQVYDAAICLCEGAFGLAGDEAGHRAVLAGVARALKPGARFVLTAISALHFTRGVAPEDPSFDPYTLTKLDRELIRSPEGEEQEVDIYTTAFTYRELKWLLEGAGFEVEHAWGCTVGNFARRPLTVNDIEIMMVARRT